MLLCDIGNTSYHFLDDSRDYRESVTAFNPSSITQKVYYISVNASVGKVLETLDNWINLKTHVDMSNYYETMGVDRIFACEAIQNGVIVDAGSAITVDIVKDGKFQGGFIYPGITAMSKTYENISPALAYPFNFDLDLTVLPKNSGDAISYGYLKTFYSEVVSHEMEIYLTGGDAKEFTKIFSNAKVDEILIFKGMSKILKAN
ncbi:MAG: type III pantothenate kinase [Sulfurimonas sp.]|nr:type III pantothenate kinase [Sulfurimonas sp.]